MEPSGCGVSVKSLSVGHFYLFSFSDPASPTAALTWKPAKVSSLLQSVFYLDEILLRPKLFFMLLLLAHDVHITNQEPCTNKSDWSI